MCIPDGSFIYKYATKGIVAYGYEIELGGEFWVLRGSTAVKDTKVVDSCTDNARRERAEHVDRGDWIERILDYLVVETCVFSSKTAAADAMAGNHENGQQVWDSVPEDSGKWHREMNLYGPSRRIVTEQPGVEIVVTIPSYLHVTTREAIQLALDALDLDPPQVERVD